VSGGGVMSGLTLLLSLPRPLLQASRLLACGWSSWARLMKPGRLPTAASAPRSYACLAPYMPLVSPARARIGALVGISIQTLPDLVLVNLSTGLLVDTRYSEPCALRFVLCTGYYAFEALTPDSAPAGGTPGKSTLGRLWMGFASLRYPQQSVASCSAIACCWRARGCSLSAA
jgi:hypothetical protein